MARILKIVITGPFNAGKSQFIRTVSEIEVASTERRLMHPDEFVKAETTVAMDYGRTTLGSSVLRLFGTPGQPRFDFMWKILAQEMDGFILLVDSSDRTSLPQAGRMIKTFSRFAHVPHVVAANKQDMAKALPPDKIHELLKLNRQVKVLPLVATDRNSAVAVLTRLTQAVH